MIRTLFLVGLTTLLAACGGGKNSVQLTQQPVAMPEVTSAIKAEVVWRNQITVDKSRQDVYLYPRLQKGIVYAVGSAGEAKAISAASGKQLFSIRTKRQITAAPGLAPRQLLLATDGTVIAVDLTNAAVLWRHQLGNEILAAPVQSQNTVLVRTIDGSLTGLSAVDGTELWNFRRSIPALTLRGQSRPVVFRGTALIGYADGTLVAVDITSGKQLWKTAVGAISGRDEIERLTDIDASPLLLGSVLYIAAYHNKVMALALGSRRLLWNRKISTFEDYSVDQNTQYLSDETGKIWALDRLTGAVRWVQEGLRWRRLAGPTVYSKYLLVAERDSNLIHVLNKADGRYLTRLDLPGPAASKPLAVAGDFVVQTLDGKLLMMRIVGPK